MKKLTAENWKKEFEKQAQFTQFGWFRNGYSSKPIKQFIFSLLKAIVKDLAGEEYIVEDYLDEEYRKGSNQHRQEVLKKGEKWVK